MMPVEKSIIIVEDEPDTAEMLAEMMRLSGFHVVKSFGSKAAMSLISQVKPAAVVLDVMMPDLPGLEVLRFMRRNPLLTQIPVVIVSAKSLPDDKRIGLEAGASIYLTKPVAFQELRKAVEKAIVDAG